MIKSIQTLRLIAVIGVFLSHLSFLTNTSYKSIFENYFYNGYCFVTFFFILSGFVISLNYYEKINTISFNMVKAFFIRRVKRMYFIHFITFMMSLIILYKEFIKNPIKETIIGISNITLIHAFIPIRSFYFSFNQVSWFLSVVVFLSVLTPYFIFFTKVKLQSNSRLLQSILIVYLFQLIFTICVPDNHWLLYINPLIRMGDYYIGILLGNIVLNQKEKMNLKYGELIIIVIFILIYIFSNQVPIRFRYDVLFSPIFIIMICIFSLSNSKINGVFSKDFLVNMGNKSFEFYMVHTIVIGRITKIIDNNRVFLIILLSFSISLLMSYVLNIVNLKLINMYNTKVKKLN